jgi:hypothetical protein
MKNETYENEILLVILTFTVCLLLLSGCATLDADLTKLRTLTVADVQRAVEINRAANDLEGLQCAEGLLKILQEQQAQPLPKPVGVVSAVAYARATRIDLEADNVVLRRINLACAAAFNESVATWAKLAARLGIAP